MKNIVFSANTSWYLYNFKYSILQSFIENGFVVYCVSPKDDFSDRLVNEIGCKWVNINIDNKGTNPFKDLITCYNLYSIFRKLKPKYIFNFTVKNNIYGTLSGKLSGSKVINNVSGLGTVFIHRNAKSKVVSFMYKLSQPMADKVFCQNDDDFDTLVNKNLVSKKKLELLPGSGVNIHRFHPDFKIKIKNNIFSFLYVGRFLADKGLYELISACELLYKKGHKFKIILCGFTDNKNITAIALETIHFWAKKSYIDWVGYADDVREIYSTVDCVVLPSYREGMPKSLLEAGAMGLPSIATNVAGCKHIITHEFNGYLCKSRDILSLSKMMEKMMFLTKVDYDTLCLNARKRVEMEFDESIVINKTLSLIV